MLIHIHGDHYSRHHYKVYHHHYKSLITMKVICAGMAKTGTKSIHAALEELGYEVYDFPENFAYYFDHYKKMIKNGWTTEEFRKMYEKVDATCDGPAYYFWEEILQAFPDAKVILARRESENEWFKSMARQLKTIEMEYWYRFRFYNILSTTMCRLLTFAQDITLTPFSVKEKVWYDMSPHVAETVFKQAYRRHIAHVTYMCPKGKLLVYQVTEGWKPLCDFLGHPVPEKPFPHINKKSLLTKQFGQLPFFHQARREAVKTCSLFFGFAGLIFFLMKRGWVKLPHC